MPTIAADRFQKYAAGFYAAGLVAHAADHYRRGTSVLTAQVYWAGTVLSILAVVAIVLVLTRHSWGPASAVAIGFTVAIGVAASHLLPHWSSFSDAFPGSHVDGLSYAAVIFEIVASLVFGAAGMRTLMASRHTHSPTSA